ncbi:MAG: hypothetical protein MR332_02685 [Fusicatenibacter sp.]|nr:hypothetical protein [Fusicatenibacter sp.]
MKKNISVVMTILLSVFLIVSTVFLFFHYLAGVTDLPGIGNMDGDWMTEFLSSRLPFAIVLVLLAIILLILIWSHLNRLRVIFVCCGVACTLNVVIDIGLICGCSKAVRVFPPGGQALLVGRTEAFSDYLCLAAITFVLLAAVSFSIFASIIAVKGENHNEKEN